MCRGHHHHYNSPAPYGAYVPPAPYGGMNTNTRNQPLALQDPNGATMYLTTTTSTTNWGSEYCSGCGRRAHRCRCDRRGYYSPNAYAVSNGYAGPCNSSYRRGRRNRGPVSLLVSAGVALYRHQKAKNEQKEEERRARGIEFEEELRREEGEYQRERMEKHGDPRRRRQQDEEFEDEPDDEFDDEVALREREQRARDREAQRPQYNGEQPPSYEAAIKG
ncbi:uncharacterized protein PV07_02256 [Cladophialophora immunda]|uniref:Uncharacterized protein n=1 Tax=Cladophialophora immunda TaxID=569365 RepID=A0A0D2A5F1_9EURO|nr:uncharacterized protein PV07_02256 [Cladophialophora immunda]KIW35566.1 hypothetical protein PV07_02256 [Cladophialophora immunda]OQV04809.1 hypothetical protein CLAIMM_09637 [Cladophialophora immunda]